jgi:subtilase family serine protease
MRALPVPCATGDANDGGCTNIQAVPSGAPTLGPNTPASQIRGYHPADLQSAYNFPSAWAGAGQTVGIVVANDDPNAESDLQVYRAAFGLGPCTSASGCFKKIGTATNPKSADAFWGSEASIDLDMASAVCPKCKLLLVEAKDTQIQHLSDALALAVSSGAAVVSNSYAIPEKSNLNNWTWSYRGVPVLAAAGDTSYGVNWPAAATNVIAVGGTTLVRAGNARGWSETAWSGTGSGCSAVAMKPSWQHDSGCSKRTVTDVAAVADPATPVAVYDSYENNGWVEFGGTSVATPIVAAAYALAGNGATLTGAASLYANPGALYPVTTGSNGTCSVSYLCNAGVGYNGPAGSGTPDGVAAF